jgi:hypothetical protein
MRPIATDLNSLQLTATYCNSLQITATQCSFACPLDRALFFRMDACGHLCVRTENLHSVSRTLGEQAASHLQASENQAVAAMFEEVFVCA